MKISKSALDKILSSLVPVNRAQILYKTMKKPTVMLLFSGSCCERVVSRATPPHPYISAQGRKLKKPSDGPKSIPPLTFHTKFHDFTVSGLGCRVWWVRK